MACPSSKIRGKLRMGVQMTRKFGTLALFLAPCMYSQSVVNTGPLLPPAPNARPYGNILFPGGTPIAAPAPRLGSLIPNTGQYQGGIVGPPSRRDGSGGHERTVVVPYAYPVYYNDYGG